MDVTQNCGCHVYIIPQDMDPHRAGPSIHDVLTRQDVHRSSLLWDAPLAGEEVPGVLTCRHQDKGLLEGPRIKAKWLKDQFRNPLPANASEELVQQCARFYILEMLAGIFFMDRWKGAKITTEHPMHVLRTYRLSLTSLRPNQLRIVEKCEPGFEIYNDSVEELGRLTLDDACTAGNTSEPAVGRGRQAGRRQRQGGRQSSQRAHI
ncbi:hypothetical protein CFP56_006924 [Quercus suber]|uniref:Uncharacterized protein n=1 Tax=Quercus suber TaxID=58331 RepID=A0AAW0M6R0_QUESU